MITTRLAQSRPAAADGFASIRFDDALTNPFAGAATVDADAVANAAPAIGELAPPLPEPVPIATEPAGSTIASITYPSAALGWRDRFLVYLPPGYYASATRRYPVIYLLHGDDQPASSFLRLGVAARSTVSPRPVASSR